MLDIGGWEFLLIVVLGIIIIGPKELPGTIRTISTFVRRARELAREFQWGMEEIARETDLDKVAKEITGDMDPSMLGHDLKQDIENTIDSTGEIRNVMKDDLDDGPDDDTYEWTPEIEDSHEKDGGTPSDSGVDEVAERQDDEPEIVPARSEGSS